ncbi:tail fiber assembly protein [Escherichia coli]|nr:tail fiber assembly protein [Escherichia coli]
MALRKKPRCRNAWKKYRVLLNCVDTSVVPDIEWPALP